MKFIIENQILILFSLSILGIIVLGVLLFRLSKKVSILFGGPAVTDGNFQTELIRRLTKTEAKLEEMEPRLSHTETIADASIHKKGFLRFNPFEDTGGDQSFTTALLDGKNDGIVVSSLYTRHGVRIYGKEIEKGKSKYPLSDEEKTVLEKAMFEHTTNHEKRT